MKNPILAMTLGLRLLILTALFCSVESLMLWAPEASRRRLPEIAHASFKEMGKATHLALRHEREVARPHPVRMLDPVPRSMSYNKKP